MKKTVGEYCKQYRVSKNITLQKFCGEFNIKTISSFENGRSSNIEHLIRYVELSKSLNDNDMFINGLMGVLNGNR